jgi:hypothetical protein
MTSDTKLSRRGYLASQAAVAAAAAALPSASLARTSPEPAATGPVDWRTATAADLQRFVGDRFRVTSPDGTVTVLHLIDVEARPFGPDAPADLPRAEAVSAVFDSPDKAPLVETGHMTRRISHMHLGSADLFLGPVHTRDGSDLLELTLS